MANYRRTDRLNRLFQEELSRLIRLRLKDPRVRTATVAAVETSRDLAHARVFIRTLGDEVSVEDAIRGLESAAGFMRREMGRQLRLRRIPELHFEVDRSLERARRVEELLRRAKAVEEDDPDGG